MTPATQTRFFNPDGAAGETRGNCWSACLASMLDLVKVPAAVWLPLALLAVIGAVTVDWLIWQHSPVTAFFTVAIGFCFMVHVAVERCTS